MRKRGTWWAIPTTLLLVFGLTQGRAQGAPIAVEVALEVGFGSLFSGVGALAAAPPLIATGTAENHGSGVFSLGAGLLDGVVSGTVATVGPLEGALLSAENAAGTLDSASGGVLPLSGILRLCVLGTCPVSTGFVDFPLSLHGVGGGTTTGFFNGLVDGSTVVGAPWSLLTVLAPGLTASGFAHGPLSSTATAVSPGGVVQFVSGVYYSPGLSAGPTPAFTLGRLTVSFVPEPGTGLLIGLGAALLAASGRRRRRRD